MGNIEKPKISVLMPVFNCRQFIEESVNSIIKQTFSDFEFIIIDDFSTDGTFEYLESLTDPRIKLIRKASNSGIVDSLNLGLNLAKGVYIARMDGDDISLSNRFARQVEFMERNQEVGVLGSWFEYLPSGVQVKSAIKHEEIYAKFFDSCPIAHPSVMLRRNVLIDNHYLYDSNYKDAEDYELWTRLVTKTRLANIPEVLLQYRVHDNQISISGNRVQLESKIKVKVNLYKRLVYNDIDLFNDVLIKLNTTNCDISIDELGIILKTYNEAYISAGKLRNIDTDLFLDIHISLLKKAIAKAEMHSYKILPILVFSKLFRDTIRSRKAALIYHVLKPSIFNYKKTER